MPLGASREGRGSGVLVPALRILYRRGAESKRGTISSGQQLNCVAVETLTLRPADSLTFQRMRSRTGILYQPTDVNICFLIRTAFLQPRALNSVLLPLHSSTTSRGVMPCRKYSATSLPYLYSRSRLIIELFCSLHTHAASTFAPKSGS